MSEAVETPSVADLLNLTGKTVLITGASSGIGQGIALRLAEAGANIVAHYFTGKQAAELLLVQLQRFAGSARLVQADLESDNQVSQIMQSISDSGGGLYGVVNNAGAYPVQPLQDMQSADWRKIIGANLDSAFNVSRRAAAIMTAAGSGGNIVNIASTEGLDPALGHAHYAASKAGLIMLTRSLALEYGSHGIRANSVSPGLIDKDGLADDWPQGVASWGKRAPLRRLGTPTDVADAVLFFLSPAARWISGANLLVDGGMSTVSRW